MNASIDAEEERALFEGLPDPAVRDAIFERYRSLADFLARRYAGKGESPEDLQQVAGIGLLKAIDGFDLDRGVRFSTYATATIVGELKRHFRDKGWALRVPRAMQEAGLAINRVVADLSQELQREPTIREIGERAGLEPDEVLAGMDALRAYSTTALDAPIGDREDAPIDALGDVDPGFNLTDEWAGLAPALEHLEPRQRQILYMRFFEDLTQNEIAEQIGISQMHVSRLLSKAIATLRDHTEPAEPGGSAGSGTS